MSNDQVTMIRLYGVLGSKFGRVHYLAVSNAAEAIRALGSQLRGFDAFLTQAKDNGLGFTVFYGKSNLKVEELHNPSGRDAIRIAPIILGSKNAGWVQVIVGAILVVAGYVLSPFTGGASLVLVPIGYGMVAGGVVQLLTPVPKGRSAQDATDNQPSYLFNGPVNTQAQGSAVQVVYGDMIVGSAVLSAGINSVDQAYVPSNQPANGSGGGGGGGAGRWNNEGLPA